MAFTVKLTRNHQRVLLEALAVSQEIKEKKLRNPDSRKRMEEEYYKAALRLIEEKDGIHCGRQGHKPGDNIFAWIRDQIYHSSDMSETEFGKLAINICEAAGNQVYDVYCRDTIIKRFFE